MVGQNSAIAVSIGYCIYFDRKRRSDPNFKNRANGIQRTSENFFIKVFITADRQSHYQAAPTLKQVCQDLELSKGEAVPDFLDLDAQRTNPFQASSL
ncbi:hypothetical protein EI555_015174 [Monodon monoceros]|uniref:Uncharacterized protein n=1 Tax=Monodon monoceros TaxID=40151 RepID=A0A4U1FP36_MONMO|nr:hypothetical protein EI555_015174 [Monodon monoceros]